MHRMEEKPYTVNGIKSRIHCQDISLEEYMPDSPYYHYHDYIELLYAIDGDAHIYINYIKYNFQKGDLVVINSNDLHFITFSKPTHYISVKFSPEILYPAGSSLLELKYVLPFLQKNTYKQVFNADIFDGTSVDLLFNEIITEWRNQKHAYELVIRSNILRIFSQIFRYWGVNNMPAIDSKIPDVIKNALAFISLNLDTVTEASVAEHCGYSKNHFSYAFKNAVGKNFREYLLSLKLESAEKKLIFTTDSITEIAISSGFSDASHFIQSFKKEKGTTPHQFRKNHINISHTP